MAELGAGEEVVGTSSVYGVCGCFDGCEYCASCGGAFDGPEAVTVCGRNKMDLEGV